MSEEAPRNAIAKTTDASTVLPPCPLPLARPHIATHRCAAPPPDMSDNKSLRAHSTPPRASMQREASEPVPVLPISRRFLHQHGAKLHTYTREEAPWPFCFNREIIEQ